MNPIYTIWGKYFLLLTILVATNLFSPDLHAQQVNDKAQKAEQRKPRRPLPGQRMERLRNWVESQPNADSLLRKIEQAPPSLKQRALQRIADKKAIEAENEMLSLQLDSLSGQSELLANEMDATAREIESLNLEQAQAELLLARKQLMVDDLLMGIDSIERSRMQDSLKIAMQSIELQMQRNQLQLKTYQNQFFSMILVAVILLSGLLLFLYFRSRRFNKTLNKQKKEIETAQQKSEELLLNILPKPIADELKLTGAAKAQKYKEASVLFTDFKDFSKIASTLPPDQLVADLDYCFKAFDKIVEQFRLEKIKTIGDAYMCAGGLPEPNEAHPQRMVEAAFEMQQFLESWKSERLANGQPCFEARIGIHTGPLVAGVVGAKKFAYDVWGDTVNIAARIEAGGEPGRVNISGATYQLVRNHFQCTHRGKLPAKNIGEIDMYFVEKS